MSKIRDEFIEIKKEILRRSVEENVNVLHFYGYGAVSSFIDENSNPILFAISVIDVMSSIQKIQNYESTSDDYKRFMSQFNGVDLNMWNGERVISIATSC